MHKFKEDIDRENMDISYIIKQLNDQIKENSTYSSWKIRRDYNPEDNEPFGYNEVSKESVKKAVKIAESALNTKLYYVVSHSRLYISTQKFSLWFRFKKAMFY